MSYRPLKLGELVRGFHSSLQDTPEITIGLFVTSDYSQYELDSPADLVLHDLNLSVNFRVYPNADELAKLLLPIPALLVISDCTIHDQDKFLFVVFPNNELRDLVYQRYVEMSSNS